MSEFIGSRISLVSKADIRYVGTLHEINSEKSTVALENVSSFGTEGRKASAGQPDEEVPPSDSVYDYIVFRGSDVKDLRIEEAPAPVKESKPLNDPAIVDTSSRPAPPQQQGAPRQNQNQQHQGPPPGQQQGPPPGVPPFGQYPPPPPFYPPPQGWGRGGPPGPGFPGMPPYGAPPGWYPPPGQGFPQAPGPFPPYGYPPPNQQFMPGQGPKPSPIGPGANKQQTPGGPVDKPVDSKNLAKSAAEVATTSAQKAPTPPIESKPSSGEIAAAVAQASTPQSEATTASTRAAPTGPKNGRVQPALPLQAPAAHKAPLEAKPGNVTQQSGSAPTLKDATQAATAAVAAAMAKLPNANGSAVDHLAKKVNDMRVNDQTIRAPRQPGAGGFNAGQRGRGRGAARGTETRKVDVPATDFDFESSNAKFNKQDLVKEAIAGSPVGEAPPIPDAVEEKPEVPAGGYNKSTSFFDNISSESKDRAEASGGRPGGREWRGEEQKKNLETFGQGSVDNGYRGGYRGRGRGRGGRGRGYGGNGQPGYRGRGGYRGGRGDSHAVEL